MALGMPKNAAGDVGDLMGSERLVGEWLKGYVGDRLYRCARCGKEGFTHDQKYKHELFECLKRRAAA